MFLQREKLLSFKSKNSLIRDYLNSSQLLKRSLVGFLVHKRKGKKPYLFSHSGRFSWICSTRLTAHWNVNKHDLQKWIHQGPLRPNLHLGCMFKIVTKANFADSIYLFWYFAFAYLVFFRWHKLQCKKMNYIIDNANKNSDS